MQYYVIRMVYLWMMFMRVQILSHEGFHISDALPSFLKKYIFIYFEQK
jgi:hypothetical protein